LTGYLKIGWLKELLYAEHSCNTGENFQGYDLGTLHSIFLLTQMGDIDALGSSKSHP
jgi:hypothetical protein